MKVKITAKNKKDKVAEFLLQKEMDYWIKSNAGMLEDFNKLAEDVVFFGMKWGIELTLKPVGYIKPKQGRGLGKDTLL